MVEHIDSLSLVLWGVFFLAAGIYPLGLMLGAPCNPCCGVECLPLFYRCRRQVSVNGSVPPTPSETTYTTQDAYIYTASSESTLKVSLALNTVETHWRLRGNQFVTYETELTHYATGGVLLSQAAPCQAIKPKVRVTAQGVTAPIEFPDTVLSSVESGGAVSRSVNIVASESLGGGSRFNTGANVTTMVVAASVSGSTSKVDGSVVTEPFLRGLLTATTSAPASDRTTCVLGLNGSLAALGYMNTAESCVLSWLVRVVRDSVPHEFVVSVTVNGRSNFTPIPEAGLTAVSVPSLPSPARGIRESYAPPVVTRSGADYAITVRPRRDASGAQIATIENLSLAFPLEGRCRLGLWQPIFFGNIASAQQTIIAQWSAPTVLSESTGTAGSFSFDNRTQNDPDIGAHLPDYSSDTIAFLPPWDTAIVAGTYDVGQVEAYRDDGASLPATSGAGLFRISLVEPSPMCGMPVCSLPQTLLPSGVTYTPAAGVMWGCRAARAMVLGSSVSSPCNYSHATSECLSNGSATVSLFDLFTAWNTTSAIKQAKLDALTWLDYDVEAASFTSASGTYTIEGTYDPTFERPGGCYATSVTPLNASETFFGLPARPATAGGGCFPAEVTISVPGFTIAVPELNPANYYPGCTPSWSPSLELVSSLAGDHVIPARFLQTSCNQMWYVLSDVTQGFSRNGSVLLESACDGSISMSLAAISSEASHVNPCANGLLATQAGVRAGFDTREASGRYNVTIVTGLGSGDVFQSGNLAGQPSVANGGPLPQCSGVGFTPTTFTVPLTKQPSFTYGRPDRPNDVVATGPWMPCGYNSRLWNWRRGQSQTANDQDAYGAGLPASHTVFLPENDDSEPATHTVTLTSEGSSPTSITVTVPGRCGTIATSPTAFFKITGTVNTWRQNPLESMRCVTIPVIAGRTCSWSAVASGNIAIEEGTGTGTGTGRVKAIRDADGNLSGTITITLDNPIPSGSWRYSYSPLIIQIG